MRNLLHKLIDIIFDFSEELNRISVDIIEKIKLYFRKPKYKIGQEVKCHGTKIINKIRKDYAHWIIMYSLRKDSFFYVSEGVLDFYKDRKK